MADPPEIDDSAYLLAKGMSPEMVAKYLARAKPQGAEAPAPAPAPAPATPAPAPVAAPVAAPAAPASARPRSRVTGVETPDLGTVVSSHGAKFRVARQYQDQFQGLVNALEDRGYTINPKTSGGYNDRVVAGTNTPSEHAYGRAIDVNWDENARGIRGKIPSDVALQVAKQYGMTWGGTWRNPDDMHFEVAGLSRGGAVPGAVRQQVAPAPAPAPAPDGGTGNFGVANTNLQLSPDIQAQVSQPAPSVDPELLAALANQGSPLGGGLSDIITKATAAANPTLQPRPILTDPTQANLVGQPLPLSRRLS